MEAEFDRQLFIANWELQLNQARLNDVRDAMAACTREWDFLQAERKSILANIVELEHLDEPRA